MTISAWRVSMGVFAVFVFLTLTFIALFLGAFFRGSRADDAGRLAGHRDGACCLVLLPRGGRQLHLQTDCASGGTTVTGHGRRPNRIG